MAMTGDLVRSVQDLVKSAGWETDLERLVNPVSSVVSSGGAGALQKSIDDDRLQVSLEAGCRISGECSLSHMCGAPQLCFCVRLQRSQQ